MIGKLIELMFERMWLCLSLSRSVWMRLLMRPWMIPWSRQLYFEWKIRSMSLLVMRSMIVLRFLF